MGKWKLLLPGQVLVDSLSTCGIKIRDHLHSVKDWKALGVLHNYGMKLWTVKQWLNLQDELYAQCEKALDGWLFNRVLIKIVAVWASTPCSMIVEALYFIFFLPAALFRDYLLAI